MCLGDVIGKATFFETASDWTAVKEMATRKALFLGHVMQRNALACDHVKVRVIKMKLDQYLLMVSSRLLPQPRPSGLSTLLCSLR